jgi:hypothetical protein
MPQLSTSVEKGFFRVWAQGWNTVYDEIEKEAMQYAREQLALGRSGPDIVAELQRDADNDGGIFRRFAAKVEQRLDLGSNTMFQLSSNRPIEGAELYEWVLDPSAEHCDSCLAQSRLGPRPFDVIPYPSSQPTVGASNCTTYCKCQIIPTGKNV